MNEESLKKQNMINQQWFVRNKGSDQRIHLVQDEDGGGRHAANPRHGGDEAHSSLSENTSHTKSLY